MFDSYSPPLAFRLPSPTAPLFAVALLLSVVSAEQAANAEPVTAGYRDFSYGTSVSAPTGQKPQSKLWFNDGSWWGDLWNKSSQRWEIYRFDAASQVWSSTGTPLDPRRTTQADVMWDGKHLYILSVQKVGTTTTDLRVLLFRYGYDQSTRKYALDQGFPVSVASTAPEAAVFAKDSTGRLWVTYTDSTTTDSRAVFVVHSTTGDATWSQPYVLPVANAATLDPDDISTIVSYGSSRSGHHVGILYSNQTDDTLNFAVHADGDPDTAWTRTVVAGGPKIPDDHLNIKSLMSDDSGRVFAVVKTSLNDKSPNVPTDPLIVLWVRDATGNWSSSTVWTVGDDVTRANVVLDSEHRVVYVFGSAPCCSGGAVYMKSSSYDTPNFASGIGTAFIKSDLDTNINNVTTTKQEVDSSTGLLVEAGDDHTRYYLHGWLPLDTTPPDTTPPDTTPPDTAIESGPTGTVASTSATFGFSSTEPESTFECSLDGAPFAGCTSPATYESVADGSHTFDVRATDRAANTDPTPASTTWTIDTSTKPAGIVRASFSTTVNSIAESTIEIAKPAETQAGDVLVACLALNGSQVSAKGPPAGWTTMAAVKDLSNPRVFGYYHVVQASEPDSYKWTLRGAVTAGGGIARYSGVSNETPLDASVSTAFGPASTSGTLPGVTTATPGAMLVGCMSANAAASSLTISSPSQMNEVWDIAGKRHEFSDGLRATAGPSGDATWTFSASRDWAGWLTALQPA